jgi:hypothetical protein
MCIKKDVRLGGSELKSQLDTDYPDSSFYGFPQPIQADMGLIRHVRFLPNPSQSISHLTIC